MTERLRPVAGSTACFVDAQLGSKLRALLALCAACFVWLSTAPASAYPQYAGRSEFSCSDCHYAPTGGGLINAWGRDSRDASFGSGESASEWWGHDDTDGYDADGQADLQLDLGGETRFLLLVADSVVPIPMLFEVGAVAAYGPLSVYSSLNMRTGTPAAPFLAFSREHWLMWSLNDQVSVRAGRIVLPFGLRMSDHTQYVREDFGFDRFDQSYAVEASASEGGLSVSAAGFMGDVLYDDTDLRESGAVLRVSYLFADRLELGLSGLFAAAAARNHLAGSVSVRYNPFDDAYVLAEFALQQYTLVRGGRALKTSATFARAGYFLLPELDTFVEFGHRQIQDAGRLTKWRAGLGANWQAWQWFEVIPQVSFEDQIPLGTGVAALVQAHLIY